MSHDFRDEPAPRRAFLADMAKLAAAGIVTGWTPLYQIAAHARTAGDTPPGFPADIPLYKQAFQNWSGEIAVQDVWTAARAPRRRRRDRQLGARERLPDTPARLHATGRR